MVTATPITCYLNEKTDEIGDQIFRRLVNSAVSLDYAETTIMIILN